MAGRRQAGQTGRGPDFQSEGRRWQESVLEVRVNVACSEDRVQVGGAEARCAKREVKGRWGAPAHEGSPNPQEKECGV